MRCSNGHEVSEGDNFCGRCGLPLHDLTPEELNRHAEGMVIAVKRWREARS